MHAVWPIFKYIDEAIIQKRKLVQCLFTLNSPFECPYTLGYYLMYPSMLNTIAIIEKINSIAYTLYFTIARERNFVKLFSCSVGSVQCLFVCFFLLL